MKKANTFTHEELQAVVDQAPCTISWVDSDLNYVGVNQKLAHACKIPAEEFVGRPIGFFTHEGIYYEFAKELFASKENRLVKELEANIKGETRWFFIVGAKFQEDRRAVLIGIDITMQKIAEQQMVMNEKLATLGEISASIAHEINNPLTIIKGKASMLKRLTIEDDKVRDQVHNVADKLMKSEKRIERIVNNLRGFSRDSSNDPMKDVLVSEIVADSLELCEKRLANANVKIEVDCPSGLTVSCKEVEISQVIVNLLNNASDALADIKDRWVKLEVAQVDGGVNISVTDSGSGIEESIREKILNPFFTTKEKGKGTGLGLSISKGIIERHGGKFYIDGNCPNTRFVVFLPTGQTKTQAA